MRKIVSLAIIVSLLLLGSAMTSAFAAGPPPTILRPYEIVEATIEGGGPQTVDPGFCYDTASGELIMNVYDTLIFFNGEHMETYLPQLATEWIWQENAVTPGLNTTSPEGLTWYWTYSFKIREGMPYHNALYGNVTPADIEYCFEREMVMDMDGGPQWMFYEPLLNTWGAAGLGDLEVPADVLKVGKMIDHSVESNSTHVILYLAFPGSYAPLLQILSQTWAAIYPKQWCLDLNDGDYGARNPLNPNWDGNFGATWINYHNPPLPPLDDPTMVMMGAGPFKFDYIDQALSQWSVVKFDGYWRGWPAPWPKFGLSQPKGWVTRFTVAFNWNWGIRSQKLLDGDVDYCAVPRQFMGVVLGKPAIRCIYPLPSFAVDALFFNFDIDPATSYGPINDYNVFTEDAIPRNFFGNDTWGINVRKAFAYCFDYTTFLSTVYGGEAMQPPTAIIPGLPQYNGSIPKYYYNLTKARELFETVPGLNTTGFSIQLCYNTGNLARKTVCELLEAALESPLVNPLGKFHATVTPTAWPAYLYARDHAQLTAFTLGWLADYPDAHNFAYAFYYTYGNFPWRASYSDPAMDALIELGIRTPDDIPPITTRYDIYSQIQQLVYDTCPSVALDQAVGRHFERNWIVGWYYNPIYSGNYPYNTWKWFYYPHSTLSDNPSNVHPLANFIGYDMNYDGTVNMADIGPAAAGFGASFGPPMHPRWIYRCDVNVDRQINMIDIGRIASSFGKTSAVWVAPP